MTPNQLAFYEQIESAELRPETVPSAAAIEVTKLRLKMERNGEFQALREAAAAADMWRDRARKLEIERDFWKESATRAVDMMKEAELLWSAHIEEYEAALQTAWDALKGES